MQLDICFQPESESELPLEALFERLFSILYDVSLKNITNPTLSLILCRYATPCFLRRIWLLPKLLLILISNAPRLLLKAVFA